MSGEEGGGLFLLTPYIEGAELVTYLPCYLGLHEELPHETSIFIEKLDGYVLLVLICFNQNYLVRSAVIGQGSIFLKYLQHMSAISETIPMIVIILHCILLPSARFQKVISSQ